MPQPSHIDEGLLAYARSAPQREAVEAVIEHGSMRAAARSLGCAYNSVGQRIATVKGYAARKGYSPEHDMTQTVPDGFRLRGTSTLYDQDGKPRLQWVKSQIDRERQQEMMQAALQSLGESLPREKPINAPKAGNSDLLNCYVLTDYHLGMLSWPDETGDEWDTAIAEDTLYAWFAAAIDSAPSADTAVLAQIGDFLHYDGLEAVTPTSQNVLDADTRFQKVVRVAIRALRRVVRQLLTKYRHVRLVMAEGNHDIASSIWLREWMAAIYEDEPRITVDCSADPYYCVEHGDTSLFFHHGHLKKLADVDSVFAGKFREVFGRTRHSYAHLGHLHNQQVRETNLMLVEQHPTLAGKDAYASRSGYLSQRAASVITYHRAAGCVGRVTITPEMVEAAA